MRRIAMLFVVLLAVGCASTTGHNTKAAGDSSAMVRTGVVVTETGADGTVIETCGTLERPCIERTSVGGQGGDQLYQFLAATMAVVFGAAGILLQAL